MPVDGILDGLAQTARIDAVQLDAIRSPYAAARESLFFVGRVANPNR